MLLDPSRLVHSHVPTPNLAQIGQQKAPLEVRIRMQNGIQLARRPEIIPLHDRELVLVLGLEYAVARNMEPRLAHVFSHGAEQRLVVSPSTSCPHRSAQEGDEVVRGEGAIRAAVDLPGLGRGRFGQDLLAGVGGVASSAPVGVAADFAVGVFDVVDVFLVEFFFVRVSTFPAADVREEEEGRGLNWVYKCECRSERGSLWTTFA